MYMYDVHVCTHTCNVLTIVSTPPDELWTTVFRSETREVRQLNTHHTTPHSCLFLALCEVKNCYLFAVAYQIDFGGLRDGCG